MVGCAPDYVNILLFSQFYVLKIRGVDASDMQNSRPQYNILNKDICKNSKDYVGFFIIVIYTIYIAPYNTIL